MYRVFSILGSPNPGEPTSLVKDILLVGQVLRVFVSVSKDKHRVTYVREGDGVESGPGLPLSSSIQKINSVLSVLYLNG